MAKTFNPGDRVRFIGGDTEWTGKEGVVIKEMTNLKEKDIVYVMLDNYPCPRRKDGHWQFNKASLALVESAPELINALTAALAPLFDQLKTGTSDKSS